MAGRGLAGDATTGGDDGQAELIEGRVAGDQHAVGVQLAVARGDLEDEGDGDLGEPVLAELTGEAIGQELGRVGSGARLGFHGRGEVQGEGDAVVGLGGAGGLGELLGLGEGAPPTERLDRTRGGTRGGGHAGRQRTGRNGCRDGCAGGVPRRAGFLDLLRGDVGIV